MDKTYNLVRTSELRPAQQVSHHVTVGYYRILLLKDNNNMQEVNIL